MIRAPRIPKGESSAITLANQKRQINMLLARVEKLTEQVELYARDCRQAEVQLEAIRSTKENMNKTYTRMLGWQDCAREYFNLISGK